MGERASRLALPINGPNWNNAIGATRDDFIKYPRTPHLFGSKGTDDDKHLGRKESEAFIADPSLIVAALLAQELGVFSFEEINGTTDGWREGRGNQATLTQVSEQQRQR